MKSVKFSALVAVAVIAASCAKEGTHSVDESNKVALEPMCIEASDESQTKTVLDGKLVKWTDGDQIAVYSNIDGYKKGYTFPATDIKGNSATFNGEVPAGTESFFAVYPPERVSSASASGAVVTIPSDQTPAEGTFGEELNITIAKGTKTPGTPNVGTIRFRNVCSYVKFTVPAYVSDVKSVKISSDNAIAGKLTVDYTGEKPSSTIAADGEKSILMSGSFGAAKTFIFVIAPGTVSNFRIDITAANGNWTRTVKDGFTATAGVPTNLGTIDFKQVELKAEAKHVYQNGILVGTDLSVNLGLLKYVSNFNFVVKKGNTTVRSYSRESSEPVASSTVSLFWKDYADEWPYLPQGEYTIEGSYTRPGGSTQAISGAFTVTEKPTLSVNATGMTSYSYYSKNNITQANDCQAETIYGLGGTATISQTILDNDNYSYSASYTLDGSETTAGDKAGQSWGPHTIKATYTFDGVTVTSPELVCYITGLPYKAVPPTNSGNHAWSIDNGRENVTFADTYLMLRGCLSTSVTFVPKVNSPSFSIPTDVNIKSTTNYIVKSRKGWVSTYHCTLYETIGADSEITLKKSSQTSEEEYTDTYTGKLTTSKPYIVYRAVSTGGADDESYARIKLSNLEYGNKE